ncbi:MAG: hypothetical protein HY897_22960, partial [Deltaproteobacteria bacterium]|nr:hypothetical protein [Deltaproteobacteria bacterium]
AVAAGTDPEPECAYSQANCDTGFCSGSRGACQKATSGTCVAQSCTADLNSINLADTCNGSGTCIDNGTSNCLPYKCNGATGACKTSCSVTADCQTGYDCAGTVCKKIDGQACTADGECFHNKCCGAPAGICRDLATDPANCGACGTICSGNHVPTPTCGASVCNGTCESNWTDCDANKQTNGCEKNLTNDPSNCGACGRICGTTPGYIYPDTATYTCNSSVCAVATCNANYYNFDAVTNPNGCECGDLDVGNKVCTSAVNMGTVNDTGQTLTATGNIPKSGDAVWYAVTASNPNWQQWGGANPYRPKIGFSTNPSNEFQLEVFSNCSGTYASCPEADKTIEQTRPTDMWEFNPAENPCYWTGVLWPGEYQCLDHTSTFYIKVTRRTGALNCSTFTVQVTNAL